MKTTQAVAYNRKHARGADGASVPLLILINIGDGSKIVKVEFCDIYEHEHDQLFSINAFIAIDDKCEPIQIQFDDTWHCWSLDVDGNAAFDIIESMIFSAFEREELYTYVKDKVHDYEIESDLYCEIKNEILPFIDKEICRWAEHVAKEYIKKQEKMGVR